MKASSWSVTGFITKKKTGKLRKKGAEFVIQWRDAAYDEYIAGNDFTERDKTCLSDIYRKYMPERSRIQEALFKGVPLDSKEGKRCLHNMISLCTSTEKAAYYPGMNPVDGRYPVCQLPMSRYVRQKIGNSWYPTLIRSKFGLQARAKHILQCQRHSLNTAPYIRTAREPTVVRVMPLYSSVTCAPSSHTAKMIGINTVNSI